MQHNLRHGLQSFQAALAVILTPELGRMGEQNFQRQTVLPQDYRQ
jgi:hypothetical protein